MTQVYTCYHNTVFYFDISHSLSSQHVSALTTKANLSQQKEEEGT
jgi:hypothetical protein